jgi:hypothetical protein
MAVMYAGLPYMEVNAVLSEQKVVFEWALIYMQMSQA